MIWNRVEYPEVKVLKDHMTSAMFAVVAVGSVGAAVQFVMVTLFT